MEKITYAQFISNIISQRGQFGIPDHEFFEQHHILPKCLGGLGDYKNGNFKHNISRHPNCIRLYPREHFIAHKLLAKENPQNSKLVWAWQAMWMLNDFYERYEPTPEEYEERKLLLHACGLSDETKYKMSLANSGNKNGMFGKHHSIETREKLRQANLGKEMHWWTNGIVSTMARECPGVGWASGRLKGFHDKKPRKIRASIKNKKYLWKLPDGTTQIMDKSNVTKWHKDWILLEEITND